MECFEWWTFEISTIVAGAVDELQLAVNTILMQFGLISFAVRTLTLRVFQINTDGGHYIHSMICLCRSVPS